MEVDQAPGVAEVALLELQGFTGAPRWWERRRRTETPFAGYPPGRLRIGVIGFLALLQQAQFDYVAALHCIEIDRFGYGARHQAAPRVVPMTDLTTEAIAPEE